MAKKIEVELPVIPREVANEIERMREEGSTDFGIVEQAISDDILCEYSYREPHRLLVAITHGYTVEQSPEEKVREYYEQDETNAYQETAIRQTLDLLGIKITGVNA